MAGGALLQMFVATMSSDIRTLYVNVVGATSSQIHAAMNTIDRKSFVDDPYRGKFT